MTLHRIPNWDTCIYEQRISLWLPRCFKMPSVISSRRNAIHDSSSECSQICDIHSSLQETRLPYVRVYKLKFWMPRLSTITVSLTTVLTEPGETEKTLLVVLSNLTRDQDQESTGNVPPSMEMRTMLRTTARDALLSYLRRWRRARKSGEMQGTNDSRKVDIVRNIPITLTFYIRSS